jgi:von Willebrand factor type A domain
MIRNSQSKLIVVFLILIGILFCYAQKPVPPVQKGKGDTLIINPDPNITGSSGSKTSGNIPQQAGSEDVSLNIIIDYSSSMADGKIEAVKNSALTLIDLIKLWSKIYPKEISRMKFQFIRFGGKGEYEILHPLGKIHDYQALKDKIVNSKADYGSTDYNSGFLAALEAIQKGKITNTKTIFLSDGEDHSDGPKNGIDYDLLGDVKFLLFKTPDADISNWERSIRNSSTIRTADEYQVTSIFISTLFEYVGSLNDYLVRMGKSKLQKGEQFVTIKHGTNKEHCIVISRPNNNIKINSIYDNNNTPLSDNDYILETRSTFFLVTFMEGVPRGKKRIEFEGLSNSQYFEYISFEKANILLYLQTIPAITSDGFLEYSSVNFDFKFWDNDQNENIDYPDFLSNVAFRYKIHNSIADYIGKDLSKLTFKKSLPVGSAGKYEVHTAWNYDLNKLKNNQPPAQKICEFKIEANGSLVHIDFDETQLWEGRSIVFRAALIDDNEYILNNYKTLTLNLDHYPNSLELKQDPNQKNAYTGTLKNAKPGKYQLSLDSPSQVRLGIDGNSTTQFEVGKRYIVFGIEATDFSSIKQNMSLWQKIKYSWLELVGNYSYEFKYNSIPVESDIAVQYELPYKGEFNKNAKMDIKLNKMFPGETLELAFSVSGDSVFSSKLTKKGKAIAHRFFGVFNYKIDIEQAVEVKFDLPQNITLLPSENMERTIAINKKSGMMNFKEYLQEEPKIEIIGTLQISDEDSPNNHPISINLPSHNVTLEIKTSSLSWWLYNIGNIGAHIIFYVILIIILFILLIIFLIKRRAYISKLSLWHECEPLSPQDFIELFPEIVIKKYVDLFHSTVKDEIGGINEHNSEKLHNKRILKYLIFYKREKLSKLIAKYSNISFLNNLKLKLCGPAFGTRWEFSGLPQYQVINISSSQKDEHFSSERQIRTRIPIANSYGFIRKENEGTLYKFQCGEIKTEYRINNETTDLYNNDSIPIKVNSNLLVGAEKGMPVFILRIEFIDENKIVCKLISQNQGGI